MTFQNYFYIAVSTEDEVYSLLKSRVISFLIIYVFIRIVFVCVCVCVCVSSLKPLFASQCPLQKNSYSLLSL